MGGLQYRNATVTFGSYTLTHQVLGNYPSQTGDSGSPIFHIDENDRVSLIGAHVGKGCRIIELDGFIPSFSILNNFTNSVCQNVHPNDDNPDDDVVPIKVFSTWEIINEVLDLSR